MAITDSTRHSASDPAGEPAPDPAAAPWLAPAGDAACEATGEAPLAAPAGAGDPPGFSVVLAAADPAALARFYGVLLQVAAEPGFSASHWRVPLPGGGGLELYAPSRRRPAPAPGGRLAPCLRRSGDGQTLADWLDAACALGAALVEGPRQEPFGWEAWLRDPEGNPLLLLVPAA